MTDKNGQPITWLEYRAQATGKSVEDLRQEMRERGMKADKTKSGFAALSKERRIEIAASGGKATAAKRRKNGLG